MRTKALMRWSFLLVATLGIFSCSKQNIDYASVIPADATVVVAVHGKELYEKGDLGSSENKMILDEFINSVSDESTGLLLREPQESGIDLSYPIFYFLGSDLMQGVVAKVDSEEKVAQLMSKKTSTVKQTNGFRYIEDGGMTLAFDDKRVLILMEYGEANIETLLTETFKRQPAESVLATEHFKKVYDRKAEIKSFVSYQTLINSTLLRNLPESTAEAMSEKDFSDVYYTISLGFEAGKAKLLYGVSTKNKEYNSLLEQSNKASLSPSKEFFKYFESKVPFFLNVALDGAEQSKAMRAFYPAQFQQQLVEALGVSPFTLFEAVRGDVSLGVHSISQSGVNLSVYARLADEAPLRTFIDSLPRANSDAPVDEKADEMFYPYTSQGGLSVIDADNFSYSMGDDSKINFGFRDKVFYLSFAQGEGKNLWTEVSEDVSKASNVNDILGNSAAVFYNIEALLETPLIKGILMMLGNDTLEQVQKLSAITVASTSDMGAEVEVRFTNKKENALKQIVDIVRTISQMK